MNVDIDSDDDALFDLPLSRHPVQNQGALLHGPNTAPGASLHSQEAPMPIYNSCHPPQSPSMATETAPQPQVAQQGGYRPFFSAPGSEMQRPASATHPRMQQHPSIHQNSSMQTPIQGHQLTAADGQASGLFSGHVQPYQPGQPHPRSHPPHTGQAPYPLSTPHTTSANLHCPNEGFHYTVPNMAQANGPGRPPASLRSQPPPVHTYPAPQPSTGPCATNNSLKVPNQAYAAPQHSPNVCPDVAGPTGIRVQGAEQQHVQSSVPEVQYRESRSISQEPIHQQIGQSVQAEPRPPNQARSAITVPHQMSVPEPSKQAPPSACRFMAGPYVQKDPEVAKLPLSEVKSGNAAVPIARTHIARWVYPSNKPVRGYQLSITESGLFDNTLVCLPTGLGKTLIAAVIMCNFYRWFPTGKVIFVAPTRPLVDQQMGACFAITDISKDHTVQLTGLTMLPPDRKKAWDSRRVFFCTPQVLDNDVSKGLCPADKVVCLIVDECHRAVGNAPVVNALKGIHSTRGSALRVIGLSATPGSHPEKIQEVIKNLRTSRLRFYSNQHEEIKLYRHKIAEDVHIVKAQGDLSGCMGTLRDVQYRLLTKLVKLRAYNHCNVDQASAFSLDSAMKNYHCQTGSTVPKETQCTVYTEFKRATFCSRLLAQLTEHGASYAADYAHQMLSNPKDVPLRNFPLEYPRFGQFRNHLESLKRLGAGEPKVEELSRVLREHFSADENAPRLGTSAGAVMVFTSMRNAVTDICARLNGLEGVRIQARKFVGQVAGKKGTASDNAGMTQKEQKAVIEDFRKGRFNVLVATCIGEEGLDIPDVDLIVCLDVSSSPTRSVQRMGRTGRHRAGRVVYILSEGAEQEKYRKGQQTTERLHEMLQDAPAHFKMLPRSKILPEGYRPEKLCYKFAVTDPPALGPTADATAADASDNTKAGMTFMSRILAERKSAGSDTGQRESAEEGGRRGATELDGGFKGGVRSPGDGVDQHDGERSLWQPFMRDGKPRHGYTAQLSGAASFGKTGEYRGSELGGSAGECPRPRGARPATHARDASGRLAAQEYDCNECYDEDLAALGFVPAPAAPAGGSVRVDHGAMASSAGYLNRTGAVGGDCVHARSDQNADCVVVSDDPDGAAMVAHEPHLVPADRYPPVSVRCTPDSLHQQQQHHHHGGGATEGVHGGYAASGHQHGGRIATEGPHGEYAAAGRHQQIGTTPAHRSPPGCTPLQSLAVDRCADVRGQFTASDLYRAPSRHRVSHGAHASNGAAVLDSVPQQLWGTKQQHNFDAGIRHGVNVFEDGSRASSAALSGAGSPSQQVPLRVYVAKDGLRAPGSGPSGESPEQFDADMADAHISVGCQGVCGGPSHEGHGSEDCCVVVDPSIPAGSGSFQNPIYSGPGRCKGPAHNACAAPKPQAHLNAQAAPAAQLPLSERVKAAKAAVSNRSDMHALKASPYAEESAVLEPPYSMEDITGVPDFDHDMHALPQNPPKTKKVKKSRLPAPKRIPKGEMTGAGRPAIEYALSEEWLEDIPIAWRGLYQATCLRYGARPAPAAARESARTAGHPVVATGGSDNAVHPRGSSSARPPVVATYAPAAATRAVPTAAAAAVDASNTRSGAAADTVIGSCLDGQLTDLGANRPKQKKVKTAILLSHLRGSKATDAERSHSSTPMGGTGPCAVLQPHADAQKGVQKVAGTNNADEGSRAQPHDRAVMFGAPWQHARVATGLDSGYRPRSPLHPETSAPMHVFEQACNDDMASHEDEDAAADEENMPLARRGKAVLRDDNQTLASRGKAVLESSDRQQSRSRTPPATMMPLVDTCAAPQCQPPPVHGATIGGGGYGTCHGVAVDAPVATAHGRVSAGAVSDPAPPASALQPCDIFHGIPASQHHPQVLPCNAAPSLRQIGQVSIHPAAPHLQQPGSLSRHSNTVVSYHQPTSPDLPSPAAQRLSSSPPAQGPVSVPRSRSPVEASTTPHAVTPPQPALSVLQTHKRRRSQSLIPCALAQLQLPQPPLPQQQMRTSNALSPRPMQDRAGRCSHSGLPFASSTAHMNHCADRDALRSVQNAPRRNEMQSRPAQLSMETSGAPAQHVKHSICENTAAAQPITFPPATRTSDAGAMLSGMFECANGAPWPKPPSVGVSTGGAGVCEVPPMHAPLHLAQAAPTASCVQSHDRHDSVVVSGKGYSVKAPVATNAIHLSQPVPPAQRREPLFNSAAGPGSGTVADMFAPSHAPPAAQHTQHTQQQLHCSPSMRVWAHSNNPPRDINATAHHPAPIATDNPNVRFPQPPMYGRRLLADVEAIMETSSDDDDEAVRSNKQQHEHEPVPPAQIPHSPVRNPTLQPVSFALNAPPVLPQEPTAPAPPCDVHACGARAAVPHQNQTETACTAAPSAHMHTLPQPQAEAERGEHGAQASMAACESDSEPEAEEGMAGFRGSRPGAALRGRTKTTTTGMPPHHHTQHAAGPHAAAPTSPPHGAVLGDVSNVKSNRSNAPSPALTATTTTHAAATAPAHDATGTRKSTTSSSSSARLAVSAVVQKSRYRARLGAKAPGTSDENDDAALQCRRAKKPPVATVPAGVAPYGPAPPPRPSTRR